MNSIDLAALRFITVQDGAWWRGVVMDAEFNKVAVTQRRKRASRVQKDLKKWMEEAKK